MQSLLSGHDMTGAPVVRDKDKPFVRFDTVQIENVPESTKQKRVVWKDVDYAYITVPGSRDIQPEAVKDWWPKLEHQVRIGRMPEDWLREWQMNYERWKAGQEIPEDGTPIKGWTLAPGSVQKMLIDLGIRTVEALASANDEALSRIGIGAVQFKRRAEAWVKDHAEKEGPAIEIASLQQKNDELQATVESLTKQVQDLVAAVGEQKRSKKHGV